MEHPVELNCSNRLLFYGPFSTRFRFLSFSFSYAPRCTLHRYRFVELHYRRKGRNDAAKTQTVVIFLPDIRSCVPTRIEWDELNVKYKQHFDATIKSGAEDSNEDMDGTGCADNIDGASGTENGSSVDGDAARGPRECDKMKPTDGDRGKVAHGDSTGSNQKALRINCYLSTSLFILNLHPCPEFSLEFRISHQFYSQQRIDSLPSRTC